MSWYREQLEQWLSKLDVKADCVLDIGGQQGNVKSRVKSWDVKDYKVLDLPIYDLEEYWWLIHDGEQADVIFCLEVFEYLIDPITAMRNIAHMLKPGGKAYITFAFCYPHHNELDMDSLRYTESGIRKLANRVELKVNNIDYRIDKSNALNTFYAIDGMKRAKQYNHHDATGFIVEFTK